MSPTRRTTKWSLLLLPLYLCLWASAAGAQKPAPPGTTAAAPATPTAAPATGGGAAPSPASQASPPAPATPAAPGNAETTKGSTPAGTSGSTTPTTTAGDSEKKKTGTTGESSTTNPPELRVSAERKIVAPSRSAGLGDRIEIPVDGLTADANCTSFVLCLDGFQIRGLKPECCRIDSAGKGWVEFVLRRTSDSTEAWNQLLGSPSQSSKSVEVTLAKSDGKPVTGSATLSLRVYEPTLLFVVLLLFVFLLALFLWLAAKSDVLRDVGPQPPAPARQPFSLARCQMAFWFFLVVGSFILITIITLDTPPLTSSVLGLIGIAAGTALGAAAVDSSKSAGLAAQRRAAESELQGLATRIQLLDQQLAAIADKTSPAAVTLTAQRTDAASRQATLTRQLAALPSPAPAVSRNFILDLVSDQDGVSFHRFQMLTWTLVLGIFFLVKVYSQLAMPSFDNTLLALMGISSGTYLGFKFPEAPKPPAPGTPVPNPPGPN
jgi:hypothetical protein